MARNFPADTKLQHFYEQNYTKESGARLNWYFATKRSEGCQSGPAGRSRPVASIRGAAHDGLPTINPMEFAIKKKRAEEENVRQIILRARSQYRNEEMILPSDRLQKTLFDGFSKEEKGRYAYLKQRHQVVPEKKYTFPLISSWDYGWKINESAGSHRPVNARTKLIKDTFYTRNGVPTLPEPAEVPHIDRSYTIV